jgi:uncharacterized protein
MEEKISKLKDILKSYGSMIVGYSGGVDSTLLCYYAHETLKDSFLAITAVSELFTPEEIEEATRIATTFSWPHLVIESTEMEDDTFTENNNLKCKWCKDIKFQKLLDLAKNKNYNVVTAGDNLDDLKDYRPGLKQAKKLGIKSPFIEAGITKADIRILAKKAGLPNHDKPSNPCLASRIPYGIPITKDALQKIYKSEKYLQSLGYQPLRVRHHGSMAKIEIPKSSLINFISFHADAVAKTLKEIGYTYVVLDIEGFRSGSLNETIEEDNG